MNFHNIKLILEFILFPEFLIFVKLRFTKINKRYSLDKFKSLFVHLNLMRVCIGGTFNQLHAGHKSLILKALNIAGKKGSVFIGVTTGEIIKNKKNVQSYEIRKKSIEQYLWDKKLKNNVTIGSINDKYGPSIEEDFDAIVVSPATIQTAYEINKKRRKIGKKALKIVKIPFILAEDNQPISSTRIRKKEIDEVGKILKQD